MVFGEERLFLVKRTQLIDCFYLRYMGQDSDGVKMKGNIPQLWVTKKNRVTGPKLYDEDQTRYAVNKIDYQKAIIWLYELLTQ